MRNQLRISQHLEAPEKLDFILIVFVLKAFSGTHKFVLFKNNNQFIIYHIGEA